MKKGWRKISCLAIATLAMVFTFATCTINIDSPETNTEQGGETAHEWDNGKITKAATENDDGEKTFTCTKCGETKTEIIAALGHKHTIASEWASDEVLHWHEASCEKEEHRADKAAHELDNGKITKAATENDDGEKAFTCAICGKTKKEAIPALGHEHTIASEWTSDEALHWHEANCGKEEHRTDKAAHEWDAGKVTTEPTCTAEGETTYTCTVCGKTKSEPLAATGHEWDDGTITKAATENDDGEKTFTCTICGKTRTEAIPALNHEHTIASEWTYEWYDEAHHWHEASCGKEEHRTDVTEHIWDAGVVAEEPKCVAEGDRIYTCTVCNKIRSEPIAAKGHSFSTTWKSDAYGHWHQCTGIRDYLSFGCYEKEDYAKHETRTVTLASDGGRKETCPTCGYNTTSAWTSETLSELSAVLDDYMETNANAKVRISGKLSDANITEILNMLKSFCERYASSKQIDMNLSGTTGLKITEQMFYNCTSLASITLPDGLTTIGGCAFWGCSSLTSVTLPKSLTTIEERAFLRCTSLTSVALPKNLTTIGDYAFCECSSLTSVTLPDGLTTIGRNAFGGCISLTSVTLPNSLTTISDETFYNCFSLTSVTLPNGLTTIGRGAFQLCKALSSIEIPGSVTKIEVNAFSSCEALSSIEIPDSVTLIGPAVFSRCTNLATITLSNGLTEICDETFSGCTSLTSIEIPDSVTKIGYYAFGGCTSLTSVTLPNGLKTIRGDYSNLKGAFRGCKALASIKIPDGVTEIGIGTFYESGLKTIEIPSSVISIGFYAFYDCKSLTSIKFKDASGWKYKNSEFSAISYELDVSDDKSIAEKLTRKGTGSLYDRYLVKE